MAEPSSTTTGGLACDRNGVRGLHEFVAASGVYGSSHPMGERHPNEPRYYHDRWLKLLGFDFEVLELDFSAANDFDLTYKEQSAEIDRKRFGAQPDVQEALDLGFHQRRYTMIELEHHTCNIIAAEEFRKFVDRHESHCLLLEGRRTAAWPRMPLYVAASFVEWQECEGNLMLTWFATYHDRDPVQTMLKSLISQLIDSMHQNVKLPRPQNFLQDRDIESTESLLQLFRRLLEGQLDHATVFLTIEGVEQYQLPGPEPRKPELDKLLNCLASIIAEDSVQTPRNHALKLLLTAHYKFIGSYAFAEDRYTRLDLRKLVGKFQIPVFAEPRTGRKVTVDA